MDVDGFNCLLSFFIQVRTHHFGDCTRNADEDYSLSTSSSNAQSTDTEGTNGMCHQDAPLLREGILEGIWYGMVSFVQSNNFEY